jgi:hypothetical protein
MGVTRSSNGIFKDPPSTRDEACIPCVRDIVYSSWGLTYGEARPAHHELVDSQFALIHVEYACDDPKEAYKIAIGNREENLIRNVQNLVDRDTVLRDRRKKRSESIETQKKSRQEKGAFKTS